MAVNYVFQVLPLLRYGNVGQAWFNRNYPGNLPCIKDWLNQSTKPSTAGSHKEDGMKRRCIYTALSNSKRGPNWFFFFGFGATTPEKTSPDPFHENIVRKGYTEKISGPYQLIYGSGPIFFCSVNGAIVTF